ncbi:hypothetical protein CE91St36_06410 [Christensenellaceae bacterium]|nr:hypothetical protein CE91St36_06410 [Christensenellaceae bacterium]BDF60492.1 hypothetical protein CE91St37_06420 [Christensenellaceae bacterium]
MPNRNIKKTVKGQKTIDGAGVHLVRVIGYHDTEEFDPFLMLDAFDSENPDDYIKGFPWHPHRGIETLTYLIHGNIEHGDSMGNKGNITDGGCQWMTAGSGILHQEMPRECGHMLGFQLWLNLPNANKMTNPKYFDITADMVTTLREDGDTIRIIGGSYNGYTGPTQGKYVQPDILDISLDPGAVIAFPTAQEKNVFIYIVSGGAAFGDSENEIPSHTAALFGDGTDFSARAGKSGVRFIYFAGKPLRESVAWGGPIVMNTQEELNHAFFELEQGTFIKHR